MKQVDVVIIGSGPAGMSAALYLARTSLSFVVLEKGAPGGKLINVPHIANYPAQEDLSGFMLAQQFLNSAARFGVEVTYGNVSAITKENDIFTIHTDDETYEAKAVIVCTGFSNVPSIPGEKEHMGKGVSYCATCDGRFYKGKRVAVYGNGDPAIQEALYLAPLCEKTYFIVPNELKATELFVKNLSSNPSAEIIESAKITKISGEPKVSSITVLKDDKEEEIEIAGVFPLVGEKSASSFLLNLDVDMEKGFIKVNDMMMSSVPGLFAAGDIVNKRLKQVVTAASDGAIATNGVLAYLNSRKK